MTKLLNIWTFTCFWGVLFFNVAHTEKLREKLFGGKNGPCSNNEFRCLNDVCLSRGKYCNGRNDCGDNSDEAYCRGVSSCPTAPSFFRCNSDRYYRCIPTSWKCDGLTDCIYGDDEKDCKDDNARLLLGSIARAKRSALNWTLSQRKDDIPVRKWGPEVSRIAVALYLANDSTVHENSTIRSEIAYELSMSLLSKLALRKLDDVSTTQLASYVNAFLVTCIDPRKFYSLDLVSELRRRVNSRNYTNPFVMLALCNAGERIGEADVDRLVEVFWKGHREFWTDTQALAVMALSCASQQPNAAFDLTEIKELSMELKRKQYRNGTVDNLKTTSLVMQALFASESEADEDNFDEEKALKQIIRSQGDEGSFGSVANAYYALPVLSYRSLVNISNVHCRTTLKDEKEAFEDLQNQVGAKWSIQYSLWMGSDRTLERTLTFNVPANTSFYRLMEYAADIDTRFRFEYSMKNGKPYIYSISELQDDPEIGMFWFQNKMSRDGEEQLIPITKSPADVFPLDKDHMIFWYKSGSWSK